MATSTRRAFLRGAAGLGTATLVPRIGWAAAGGAALPGGGRAAGPAASGCSG